MSARERRLKEYFNTALFGLAQACEALRKAESNGLALDVEQVQNRVLTLRKRMIYPYEPAIDPRAKRLETTWLKIENLEDLPIETDVWFHNGINAFQSWVNICMDTGDLYIMEDEEATHWMPIPELDR